LSNLIFPRNCCRVAIVLGQANHRISDTQAAQALNGLQLAMKGVGMQVSGLQGPAVFVDKNNALLPSDDESVGKWIMSKIKIKPQLIVCFLAEKNAWEYRQV
jgi:eukaryotic translation initiation factor 2C